MRHLLNIRLYTLIGTILLVSLLLLTLADAKHIIVIYDVSGSMIRLRTNGNVNTYMESEDIRRVNDYLINLLFTDASQSLRNIDDAQIKACESAYVGKPLYENGDILTYADYADRRYEKLRREQVRRDEFHRQLPDAMNLASAFHGQVSYLLRAEVEVYEALYSEADDGTYWIFVTDGDIDNSGKSDPGISAVLQRLAEIEGEYYAPMVFGILVNNHVRIQVRRLQRRRDIDSIFIATPTNPKEQVRNIQLSRDDEGHFTSETLTVNTESSATSKFKLNSVNVEVVDKYNKPLQVVNKDNTVNILEVVSISLHGNPPPCEFHIPFPANPEIPAPGNALKLEVTYSYNGVDKDPYSAPPMNYTAVIDSIYVSPPEPELHFQEGTYFGTLVVQSESPNKKAFKINQIRSHVQYKDGRKLCDANVSSISKHLDEAFNIVIPKEDRLDWYGNKLVLDIDYHYEGVAKSATLGTPFKLRGGGDRFPIWPLIVLLVVLCCAGICFLIMHIWPRPIEYHIAVTEVSKAGTTPLHETEYFPLKNKTILEFGPRGTDELRFDVGSPAFLHCVKKHLLLFADTDDDGRILELPETLTLRRGEDNEVYVNVKFVDEQSDESPGDDESIFTANSSDDNPLDV